MEIKWIQWIQLLCFLWLTSWMIKMLFPIKGHPIETFWFLFVTELIFSVKSYGVNSIIHCSFPQDEEL